MRSFRSLFLALSGLALLLFLLCRDFLPQSRIPAGPAVPSLAAVAEPATGEQARAPQTSKVAEEEYDASGRPLYLKGEVLLQLKEGAPEEKLAGLHAAMGNQVLDRLPRFRQQRIRLAPEMTEAEAISRYRSSGLVAIAERHSLKYFNSIPNDPDFPQQYGLKMIQCPAAWDMTTGSADVVVAVLDSGIDYLHPDLVENIWHNPGEIPGNGIDDDNDSFIDDVVGWDFGGYNDNDPTDTEDHGTHVSGIIAAVGDNSFGVTGVSWYVKVMALKINKDGANGIMYWDVSEAIDYAILQGARIVNCSFGGHLSSNIEYNAFIKLQEAGILVVAAVDNARRDNDNEMYKEYPASWPLDNIIAVTASDKNDSLVSAYGDTTVDLMAPGKEIFSTAAGNTYLMTSGSSQATAYVSGAAALLLSLYPDLDYHELRAALLDTVDQIPSVSDKLVSGGRLNVLKALQSVCAANNVPGDLTCDQAVGLDDAILALQVLNSSISLTRVGQWMDLDDDNRVGLAEASYIFQKIAGQR